MLYLFFLIVFSTAQAYTFLKVKHRRGEKKEEEKKVLRFRKNIGVKI